VKRTRTIAAVAGALALAATPVAAIAQEQGEQTTPPAKTAKAIGKAERHGKKSATLKVKYSCESGSTLWISLKQMKSAKKDDALKKEGSSAAAAAWLQSHRNKIACDGKERTRTFTVDKVEQGSKGTLKKGYAWLQFCVTQGDSLTVSVAGWVKVQ
jgi:hypothetical protein